MLEGNSGIENERLYAVKDWFFPKNQIKIALDFLQRWRKLLAGLGVGDSQSRSLFDQPICRRHSPVQEPEAEEENALVSKVIHRDYDHRLSVLRNISIFSKTSS